MCEGWRLFRLAHVAISPTAPTERLVTNGLYRVTRNPMYLGLVLMLAGAALGVGTVPFYASTIVYFLIVDRVFCRYEEARFPLRHSACEAEANVASWQRGATPRSGALRLNSMFDDVFR
jgi:protein-S-isoprenylcysteine O-methyltransferase Ste14